MGNIDNLRTPTTEQAREMQKLSVEKRRQNAEKRKMLREIILERTTEADLNEIVDRMITRAKYSGEDFKVFRDSIGEKPATSVSASVHREMPAIIVGSEKEAAAIAEAFINFPDEEKPNIIIDDLDE